MDILSKWSILIADVQKYILSKPMGTNLYVSDEIAVFFAREKSTPLPKPAPVFIPKPPMPVYKAPIAAPKPVQEKPVVPIPEEKPAPAKGPAYDFNLMKNMLGEIKPGLKILDLGQSEISCLLVGSEEEQAMMETIKKGIETTLKKKVLVIPKPLTEEECKALFANKNLSLAIISQVGLEAHPYLKSVFKTADPFHYLAGIPSLSIKNFGSLNDNPEAKRLLWNQIKAVL